MKAAVAPSPLLELKKGQHTAEGTLQTVLRNQLQLLVIVAGARLDAPSKQHWILHSVALEGAVAD